MGTARTRASNKWNAKAYDRIYLMVKKGKKEEIQNIAQSKGKSLNSFINEAIAEKIEREQKAAE